MLNNVTHLTVGVTGCWVWTESIVPDVSIVAVFSSTSLREPSWAWWWWGWRVKEQSLKAEVCASWTNPDWCLLLLTSTNCYWLTNCCLQMLTDSADALKCETGTSHWPLWHTHTHHPPDYFLHLVYPSPVGIQGDLCWNCKELCSVILQFATSTMQLHCCIFSCIHATLVVGVSRIM